MDKGIRQPQQQRSIEKKGKILEEGLKLFCEKGYYNTNSTEIASNAGVSVGILYSYFADKKDIFLQSLDLYFERLNGPMQAYLTGGACPLSPKALIEGYLDVSLQSHNKNRVAHEEMIAMSHLDADVGARFLSAENKESQTFTASLKTLAPDLKYPEEKAHIALNMIDDLCHEYIYHRHDYIDYEVMFNQTKRVLILLFTE